MRNYYRLTDTKDNKIYENLGIQDLKSIMNTNASTFFYYTENNVLYKKRWKIEVVEPPEDNTERWIDNEYRDLCEEWDRYVPKLRARFHHG